MSLCYRFKRGWDAFKNIVYGYDDHVYRENKEREKRKRHEQKRASKYVYISTDSHNAGTGRVFQEFKSPSESRSNYCIPKSNTKYKAYGIEFETLQERDAFECKMQSMERILDKELYDIKQQHKRLRQKHYKLSLLQKETNQPKKTDISVGQHTWILDSISDYGGSTFSPPMSDDPLIEEISLLNEFQDIYEQMCKLSTKLKNTEKVLTIEVRERMLYPEPRLIHIKAPEDELSQQMKSEGGLRYCSSDRSIQQISYETLPPPLTLSSLLANEQDDT